MGLKILAIAISVIFGYLIGSIPSALIIGKIFYKKDVRNEGSGNLGATNVARTLGAKPGAIVLLLDALKAALSSNLMLILGLYVFKFTNPIFSTIMFLCGGLMACLGHCYPIFANFKGGKAVSVIAGFALGSNWIVFSIGFVVFFSVFFIKRIVSISSILMSVIASGLSFIPFVYKGFYLYPQTFGLYYSIVLVAISALLVIRHKSNIVKLIKGEEKKFTFAKK